MQLPSIGRIVHFVDPTNGHHQAAVITSVDEVGVGAVVQSVCLSILGCDFIRFERDVAHDPEGRREGTWHWPEMVK